MKKVVLLIAICLACVGTFKSRIQALPVDFSIGGAFWYNRWEPAWKDLKFTMTSVQQTFSYTIAPTYGKYDSHDFKPRELCLYGPVASLTLFKRLSLSCIFIYGRTTFRSEGMSKNIYITTPSQLGYNLREFTRDLTKMDSDLTLSYHLTDYISLVAGYKNQSYSYKERNYSYSPLLLTYNAHKKHKNNQCHGAGLGLHFNLPVVDSLFFQPGFSFVVMRAREMIKGAHTIAGKNLIQTFWGYTFANRGSYLAYGGTASAAFAYRTPIGISLSLGFRCQALRYHQPSKDVAFEHVNNRYDLFYGLTFSTVYTFSFGKNKDEEKG